MIRGGSHVHVRPTTEPEGGRGRKYGGFKQVWSSASPPGVRKTTSYRQEYRPWTGAKRSRASKMKQGFIIPEDHFVRETSYKADFKHSDPFILHIKGDYWCWRANTAHIWTSAQGKKSPHTWTAAWIPEVKAKFSPNPSAVFQAPSRILNV